MTARRPWPSLLLLVLLLSGCVRLLSTSSPPVASPGDRGPDAALLDLTVAVSDRPDGPSQQDRRKTDGASADRGKVDGRKDLVARDKPWVSDAVLTHCNDIASWTCFTGPYGCRLTCGPYYQIECVEQYPQYWICRCTSFADPYKGFQTTTSLSCASCQKRVPDCFPGLAP